MRHATWGTAKPPKKSGGYCYLNTGSR